MASAIRLRDAADIRRRPLILWRRPTGGRFPASDAIAEMILSRCVSNSLMILAVSIGAKILSDCEGLPIKLRVHFAALF